MASCQLTKASTSCDHKGLLCRENNLLAREVARGQVHPTGRTKHLWRSTGSACFIKGVRDSRCEGPAPNSRKKTGAVVRRARLAQHIQLQGRELLLTRHRSRRRRPTGIRLQCRSRLPRWTLFLRSLAYPTLCERVFCGVSGPNRDKPCWVRSSRACLTSFSKPTHGSIPCFAVGALLYYRRARSGLYRACRQRLSTRAP